MLATDQFLVKTNGDIKLGKISENKSLEKCQLLEQRKSRFPKILKLPPIIYKLYTVCVCVLLYILTTIYLKLDRCHVVSNPEKMNVYYYGLT